MSESDNGDGDEDNDRTVRRRAAGESGREVGREGEMEERKGCWYWPLYLAPPFTPSPASPKCSFTPSSIPILPSPIFFSLPSSL